MNELHVYLQSLSPEQQEQLYHDLAAAALAYYDLPVAAARFLQHNSGIMYRLPPLRHGSSYLMKIAVPFGSSAPPDTAYLESACSWVCALNKETDIGVPAPMSNRDGRFVTPVWITGVSKPLYATVYRWIDGEIVTDHLKADHAAAIGRLLARLHNHSQNWVRSTRFTAPIYDEKHISRSLTALERVVVGTVLSKSEFITLAAAVSNLQNSITAIGRQSDMWGPIHGDLHQGNLVWSGKEPEPIDFGAMILGPYYYDLAVALYHIQYRGPNICQDLVSGYQTLRPFPEDHLPIIEALVLGAAVENLAFQGTIAEQREGTLFARNVRDLVLFSQAVLNGTPFVMGY